MFCDGKQWTIYDDLKVTKVDFSEVADYLITYNCYPTIVFYQKGVGCSQLLTDAEISYLYHKAKQDQFEFTQAEIEQQMEIEQ
jgi:hypothetical protein